MSLKPIKSLYFHFPFCRHLCNYCSFYKRIPQSKEKEYKEFEELIDSSWLTHEKFIHDNGFKLTALDTLYFGGGTPSLWGKSGIDYLKNNLLADKLALLPDAEVTLEVNPATTTQEELELWIDAGINRFSIGIQTLNEHVLKLIDRVHTLQESFRLLEIVQTLNVNYSVDFMLGLPKDENVKRDIIEELDQILYYQPKHISLYILTVGNKYIHLDKIPEEEIVSEEFHKVATHLKKKGFIHYEVSNYSLAGFESKHNKKYWHYESVAALGASATGFLKNSDETAIRYKWKTEKPELLIENLNSDELKLEELYMGLRMKGGLDVDSVFKDDEKIRFNRLIKDWDERGLVDEISPLTLSSSGFIILDSLMSEIFNKVQK
jgi:oxygen-independent coproporphyrinogen-3 oxidase